MPQQGENDSFMSSFAATGKNLVAMLRDAMLLLLALLLLFWPQAINNILVEAGFEEGSFAGLKWKAKLTESDETLLKAQSVIVDLKEQNDRLSKALAESTSRTPDAEVDAKLLNLEKINKQLLSSSLSVQAAVANTTSANAQFVQKIQHSAGQSVTWGVVYGGDQNLKDATYEIEKVAPKLGLTNSAIYYRQGSYRSVATTADRVLADQLLQNAKQRRKDSYIVNMATWCPGATKANGYFKCTPP